MRSRKPANEQVAEVARRRLELLGEELAGIRRDLPNPRTAGPDGPGELAPDTTTEHEQPVRDPEVFGPGRHAFRSVGVSGTVAGWVHDRLPPTLQGRVRLGSSHLTVVALLVAAALTVTAWWVVRAEGAGSVLPTAAPLQPTGTPSALVSVAAQPSVPASPGTSPPSAASGTPTKIVIDVAGKVRRPGIATLPLGSRVVDALEAAGGVRRGVRLHALNLARLLVDGEQIVVGLPPPPGVAASAASAPSGATSGPTSLVNLNSATQADLETLPGVGPVTAQAILAWRTDNGSFTAVDELLEVSGIGDATLAEMAPFVTL